MSTGQSGNASTEAGSNKASSAASGHSQTDAVSRRELNAIRTRKAILAAAKELIGERGFDEATIEAISERAEIAPRTFFRYFPNKESLLFAEFDAAREAMVRTLIERPMDEDIFESIAVVLEQFSRVVDHRWDEFTWVHEVTRTHCLADSHERALARQRINASIAELIARRLGVDTESDPRPASWAMAIMATFGQSMALGPHHSGSGRSFDVFVENLRSTSEALASVEAAAKAVDMATGSSCSARSA